MPDPIKRLWTPEGSKPVYNVERVEITPSHMQAFADFADICGDLNIGLHCGKCGADLVGKNATNGATLAMACGCREFVSVNPRIASTHPRVQ